jgi:hypothetical protein
MSEIIKRIKNETYIIKKSTRKNKKYDVFIKNCQRSNNIRSRSRSRSNNLSCKQLKFITSFGDTRYEHFYDKFGMYSNLNHLDLKRRKSYKQRHTENHSDPKHAGYWSWYWLW